MNFLTQTNASSVIVYDADLIEQAGGFLFQGSHWERQGLVAGQAQGRGSALFLETSFGPAVLRHYLRGGWAAGFSRDRYVFTGFDRSRPLMELKMLVKLQQLELPVPRPLAAHCERSGLFYRGSLLTRRIPDVTPLADRLIDETFATELWRETGKCIRKFHDQGVIHSDLNCRNILVHSSGAIYLIDFDRARVRQGARMAFKANLSRLHRSLEKTWPEGRQSRLEKAWAILSSAYAEKAGPQ